MTDNSNIIKELIKYMANVGFEKISESETSVHFMFEPVTYVKWAKKGKIKLIFEEAELHSFETYLNSGFKSYNSGIKNDSVYELPVSLQVQDEKDYNIISTLLQKGIKFRKNKAGQTHPYAEISAHSENYIFYMLNNKDSAMPVLYDIVFETKFAMFSSDSTPLTELKFSQILSNKRRHPDLSLKLYNISELDSLEDAIYNLLFELTINHDIKLSIDSDREIKPFLLREIEREKLSLRFPDKNYPTEPLNYYLSATTSSDPILSYVLYFEVLEYYTNIGAKKIIKDSIETCINRIDFKVEKDKKNSKTC